MISSEKMCRERMYVCTKKGRLKKLGRVRAVVFHPEKPRAVGYIVKRPDLLWMFKRGDRFVAADRVERCEGSWVVTDGEAAYDAAACRRLGVDYEECIIWEGMPVRSEDGRDIGEIASVFFDEKTLRIDRIDLSSGSIARKLLGEADVMLEDIIGYGDGAIVVRSRVKTDVEEAGGVAARAGETWAVTKHKASEGAAAAGEAVDRSAEAAGRAVGGAVSSANAAVADALDAHEAKKDAEQKSGELTGVDKAAKSAGKQLGRAKGMFAEFKAEYDKAAKGE